MIGSDDQGLLPGARVVVAMSGGVDSSTVAALLVEAGHEVIGITLQLYDHGAALAKTGACCAGQDIHDARRVADRLDIPHYVLDFEARFRERVIDDFASTYAEGRTPIPCVRCNQRIKFDDMLDLARDLGADALATGHYVRWRKGPLGPELHTAVDDGRDQSYFLFATTRAQLGFVRFPLGDLRKDETRRLAARFGLDVAAKPDSQDICFVPEGHYTGVVGRLRPEALEPGEIVHVDGTVLGEHRGIANYTVGQRRGLGVAATERLYVAAVEGPSRRVVVGPRAALEVETVLLSDLNWLADDPLPPGGVHIEVRCRANETRVPALLIPYPDTPGDPAPGAATSRGDDARETPGRARVVFDRPQTGIAPGQACVFYLGTRVLGGGWIEAAPRRHDG